MGLLGGMVLGARGESFAERRTVRNELCLEGSMSVRSRA